MGGRNVLKIIVRFRSIILRTTGRLGWLPPTLARLCLGLVFFNSGWGKLHGLPSFSFTVGRAMPDPIQSVSLPG